MFSFKRLIGGSLFVFVLACTSLAQENRTPIDIPREPVPAAPLVTAAATAKRVRFVSPGTVVQLRLEVYNEAGQKLIDTELRGGNVLDWHLQDGAGQRLQAGSYACVLTIKSLSGRLSQRVGLAMINDKSAVIETAGAAQLSTAQQQTIGPLEDSAGFSVLQEKEAITAVTHDGTDGQLTSTTGALTFRTGDLFSGRDIERMRITPEGNVGIGTDKPEAKLDVAGSIRARGAIHAEQIEFADGTVQASGMSGRKLDNGTISPNATGSGTLNFISKWIDNAGTLGDSVLFESSGRIGLGTTTPGAKLHVIGTQGSIGGGTFQLDTSTQFGNFTEAYPAFEVINTNPTNNNVSFFQFADGPSGAAHSGIGAVNTNHAMDFGDLFFFTKGATDGYQVRMGVFGGKVGIGTTAPNFKLHVNDPSVGLRVETSTPGGIVASFGGTGAFWIDRPGSAGGRFAVTEGGNVGIGTVGPLAKLEILGGADADGSFDQHALAFGYRLGGYRHWIRTRHNATLGSGNAIDFFVNDSTGGIGSLGPGSGSLHVMTLDSGRVGIGIENPIEKLSVAGTVQSTVGGFKFPDGSRQTNAVGTAYTVTHSTNLQLTEPGVSVAHLDLPAGVYLLTATVEFFNYTVGQFTNRDALCSFPDDLEYRSDVAGVHGITLSYHTVKNVSSGGVDLTCRTTSPPDSLILALARRLTAVRIDTNSVNQ